MPALPERALSPTPR